MVCFGLAHAARKISAIFWAEELSQGFKRRTKGPFLQDAGPGMVCFRLDCIATTCLTVEYMLVMNIFEYVFMFMCVCICMCMCVCVYVLCIHVCICICKCMCVCMCKSV